jgi:hypothetical protein
MRGRALTHVPALTALAVTEIAVSVGLMILVGSQGPSVGVARFPAAPPWPPWYFRGHPSAVLVPRLLWLAILLGAMGLVTGLVAARRGWRPRPRHLIAGSVLAVSALLLVPPMGSADMLDYAVFGRIAALGHSPYVMTPGQLKTSGDPVGAVAVPGYQNQPSRYGPVATGTEAAASELAGASAARTIFWLKVWNGLAYLALVLTLDRLVRSDAAHRVRAHLLWSLNPLMLWAVMAGGHNDGLAVCFGASALFALRRGESRRAILAGLLLGLAAATKAPFVLFGAGLAWAARRSLRSLAALTAGAAVIVIPGYLLAGRAGMSATMGVATMRPVGYTPWFAAIRVLHLTHAIASINALGLIAFVLLAVILLWRMPSGPLDFPAVRGALAVTLAWLTVTPQQHAWYFVMIFPLAAVMPQSRLDWIAVASASTAAVAALPRLYTVPDLHPAWLGLVERGMNAGIGPLVLTITGAGLLWLCYSNDWSSAVLFDDLDPSGGPLERSVHRLRT